MLRILAVDDHVIVREGLKLILKEAPEMVVAGEAANAEDALRKARSETWDLVLLDISLPDRSGLEVLTELRNEGYRPPVLIFSMHTDGPMVASALRAGASGYITKSSAPEQLIAAIRKVAGGGRFVSAGLAEDLAFHLLEKPPETLHETLSAREFELLRRIAAGQKPKDIATEMGLNIKTVSAYRVRLLRKMSMKSNAELIHYAIRTGLVANMP